jgi:hypothetical protein
MIDQIVHTSYDLIQNVDGTWTLKAGGVSVYRGDLKTATTYMLKKFGFRFHEIEIATEEMESKDHNHAHFGSYRSFIFTTDKRTSSGAA